MKAIEIFDLLKKTLSEMSFEDKVTFINSLKELIKSESPFNSHPVDCVLWVKSHLVTANDYNPNVVAPTEMKLLEHSILEDGYTQPIVVFKKDNEYEVVDGFHRNRVGKESLQVNKSLRGYLPVVVIDKDLSERMASTIRHNRARGKHKVESMAEIVLALKRRKWSDEKISKELGMDKDEILRLSQVGGLASLFADKDFSEAWDAED